MKPNPVDIVRLYKGDSGTFQEQCRLPFLAYIHDGLKCHIQPVLILHIMQSGKRLRAVDVVTPEYRQTGLQDMAKQTASRASTCTMIDATWSRIKTLSPYGPIGMYLSIPSNTLVVVISIVRTRVRKRKMKFARFSVVPG